MASGIDDEFNNDDLRILRWLGRMFTDTYYEKAMWLWWRGAKYSEPTHKDRLKGRQIHGK